jgi:hypothetical protein
MEDKIKSNIEQSEKLVLEYKNLNDKIYNRDGYRMTELEKLLDINNKEFMELIKQKQEQE